MINITSIYCKSLQSSCVQQVGCVSQDMRLSENRVPLDPLLIIIIPIKIINLEGIPIFSETHISYQVGYSYSQIPSNSHDFLLKILFPHDFPKLTTLVLLLHPSSVAPGCPGAGVQKVQSQCAQRRGAKLIQPW